MKPVTEASIIIAGGRGRPALYGSKADRVCRVRLTDSQKADLASVAQAEGRKMSMVIRDAIDSYVGDFRERSVFQRPGSYLPE